jgi:AraC-like DNA-binding protein
MDGGTDREPTASSSKVNGHLRFRPRVIDEADDYTATVAGVTLESVRVGRGLGPNVVLGIVGEPLTVTTSRIGFPMHSFARIPENQVAAAFVLENPRGSRWCGVELQPGSAIVYPPGTEHYATNQPELRFGFVIADAERVATMADTSIGNAGLHEIAPSHATQRFGLALNRLATTAVDGQTYRLESDEVLCSVAELLTSPRAPTPGKHARGIDSRVIVHACLDFVRATRQIPSLAELCNVAHVSERRLRSAFCELFDEPPTRYFRHWGLGQAHRHLRDAGPDDGATVTSVASELGFAHLGRFAAQYRHVFGVAPSETLADSTV